MTRLHILRDPEAEKRSLMSQQVPRCNGQQDGQQCVHYWFVQASIQPLKDADQFKRGERLRRCLLVQPTQNLDFIDLATTCTQYKAGPLPYDPNQEKYDPLTYEETSALEVLQERHRGLGQDTPFLPSLALAEFQKLAVDKPDDPLVVEIRAKADEQRAELEARKRDGEDMRRRNVAIADYTLAVEAWWANRPTEWHSNEQYLAAKPVAPPGAVAFDPDVAEWQAIARAWWDERPLGPDGKTIDEAHADHAAWLARKPQPRPSLLARLEKK